MATKYPDDWRGHNNVAYVYLQDAKTADAMPHLDRANQLSPNNKIVLNNYGVAHAMMKDYVKAEDYYKQAKDAGVNEDVNMGLLNLRQGRYTEAIDMMKDKCEFNVALAYTLKGEYENAKKSLECVKLEKRNALYYYLYSIVGARTDNLDMVTSNLTRSIQMDAKYRDMAKKDLEFRKVKDRAEFQNAIR
jgi:Flp pilus assembly protein TadD